MRAPHSILFLIVDAVILECVFSLLGFSVFATICSSEGAAVQGSLAVAQILAVVVGRKTEVFRRHPFDAAEDDSNSHSTSQSSSSSTGTSSSSSASALTSSSASGGDGDDCDRRCLSLLSADRTLDLRAATPAVRAAWDRDLKALLDMYRRSL
jgi:hypothetical protein